MNKVELRPVGVVSKASNAHKWSDIKSILSRSSERDLLKLIQDLYNLSDSNKDFLEARFMRDGEALLRYKDIIKEYIAPRNPWSDHQISIKEAKKILSEYKKATNDAVGLIDLMICYVEYGTDFICEFGDMYEQYYASLESVFGNALKLMKDFENENTFWFVRRLRVIVEKAENVGWGYYDILSEMINDAYPEED